jgi:TolA-binding protein
MVCRSHIVIALAVGLLAAFLIVGLTRGPMLAAGEGAPGAVAIQERVSRLEEKLARLEERIGQLASRVDEQREQLTRLKEKETGEEGKTKTRIEELEKQVQSLLSHTHDYLQEGRTADGTVRTVRPEEFMGSGLTGTGSFRIGKPILGQ